MGRDDASPALAGPPELELMRQLAEGNDLALNQIMSRWKDRLAAFLFRRIGSHDVAVDLAQETFVKLYQARLRYRPSGQFSTYLFSIAANLARNHVRWAQRHPTISLDDRTSDPPGPRELRDPAPTPERVYTSTELERSVQQAFKALPDDLCEAMTLFIYEDMSYADIASVAGCSAKAVETRIYRARQLLKESLKTIHTA